LLCAVVLKLTKGGAPTRAGHQMQVQPLNSLSFRVNAIEIGSIDAFFQSQPVAERGTAFDYAYQKLPNLRRSRFCGSFHGHVRCQRRFVEPNRTRDACGSRWANLLMNVQPQAWLRTTRAMQAARNLIRSIATQDDPALHAFSSRQHHLYRQQLERRGSARDCQGGESSRTSCWALVPYIGGPPKRRVYRPRPIRLAPYGPVTCRRLAGNRGSTSRTTSCQPARKRQPDQAGGNTSGNTTQQLYDLLVETSGLMSTDPT